MATKRIKDLTTTATVADLVSNRYGVLDAPDITKKLPGNLLGGGGGGGGTEIALFEVMWDLDENDYIFPSAQDIIQAVSEYIEVRLVFNSPGGVKYVYSLSQKSALHYEWTREDCQSKFNLDGAGDPVVWTWTENDTRLKQDIATLDTDIGKIGGSIAPAHDAANTYAVGDLVMYARRLYECTTAITTPEAWDATHWTRTDVKSIIGNVETLLAAL